MKLAIERNLIMLNKSEEKDYIDFVNSKYFPRFAIGSIVMLICFVTLSIGGLYSLIMWAITK